jgi:hypothetical protein
MMMIFQIIFLIDFGANLMVSSLLVIALQLKVYKGKESKSIKFVHDIHRLVDVLSSYGNHAWELQNNLFQAASPKVMSSALNRAWTVCVSADQE